MARSQRQSDGVANREPAAGGGNRPAGSWLFATVQEARMSCFGGISLVPLIGGVPIRPGPSTNPAACPRTNPDDMQSSKTFPQ
jgi:hypothetical protein